MKLDRVFHILARDDNASAGADVVRYGLAREDAPKQYPNARLCSKCTQLARGGLADDMMDVSETDPFATGDGDE